jgi:integral membrane protein 2B
LFRGFFSQINREFDVPLKDIRSMESEIQSLDDKSVQEKFFRDEIEIQDDDDESYADIKIPDFRDGRRGRFIHDFKNNQTTIVDEDSKRCFVYPLDYETTMPPKSIIDVFIKMQTG